MADAGLPSSRPGGTGRQGWMADRAAEIDEWLSTVQEQLVQADLMLACLPATPRILDLKKQMADAARWAAGLRLESRLHP